MILLEWIPIAVWYAALIAGVLGILASIVLDYVPLIRLYNVPIQIVSTIVALVAMWALGADAMKTSYEQKVAELQLAVARAEAAAAEANAKVEYVYQDKIKVIKDTQIVVQEKIRDIAVTVDSQCKITAETIEVLNMAAKGVKK